ncbi:mersacidin/lichenicidin family type 2 lantibiotic [Dictyobacter formicarum]|uniref:Uncharacterized protein n=1 Tax=Dictyobacter formicarum TaxID=2778368 RepID=A0ABQ3VEC3_9CHLR|nr:mersacidin/lichenicidin family type 2 lantibiotic [Dictyobacter formicarum]GHO83491.1 hypothetical protein KSZ_14970 [Dictyobacter formicarum]
MNNIEQDYRTSLTSEEQVELPQHPSSVRELAEEELAGVHGAFGPYGPNYGGGYGYGGGGYGEGYGYGGGGYGEGYGYGGGDGGGIGIGLGLGIGLGDLL